MSSELHRIVMERIEREEREQLIGDVEVAIERMLSLAGRAMLAALSIIGPIVLVAQYLRF